MTETKEIALYNHRPIKGKENVGLINSFERGETTVTFKHVREEIVKIIINSCECEDDEDNLIYVGCDGGELSLSESRENAPIETNLSVKQAQIALQTLEEQTDVERPKFTIHFDHQNPIIFQYDDIYIATVPTQKPEQRRMQPVTPSIKSDSS